jgi:hypothetical protein
MTMARTTVERKLCIVLGCGEIGSAIAHCLAQQDHPVVLVDEADPHWSRRGMAYTDAWYVGTASLEGRSAVFCASVRSIPAVLSRGSIAATTWSWAGIAGAIAPLAVIDARPPLDRSSLDWRRREEGFVRIAVGCGPADAGADRVVPLPPEPRDQRGRVHAPLNGRFVTGRKIGEEVRGGETLGAVSGAPVIAPLDGRLRGLSARGARVPAGLEVAAVDAARDAQVFGLDERGLLAAGEVLLALREGVSARA